MKGRKPFRIVLAEPYAPEAVARLEEVGVVTILGDSAPETLVASVADADALLIRGKAHVTARIIEAAPKLKVIGRASPTIDHIDLRAARRREISVVYAPHAAVASAAEFTLALILAVQRRIPFFDRQLREGRFDAARQPSGHDLGRSTVGILGLDDVAEKLGAMLIGAFGCRIIHHDPLGSSPSGFDAEPVDLTTFLQTADVISIHLRLTPETRQFFNAERIRMMKNAAVLVNASRGPLVDTVALAEALEKRYIGGAALDVFEAEPLPSNHPLRKSPNCLLTPHVAGATLDASLSRFNVADDVVRVLKGEQPLYPVKKPSA